MDPVMTVDRYEIKTTENADVYEGIRTLWCEIFGDGPEFVDHVYRTFGGEITGYAATDGDGTVVSALTVYRCGDIAGRSVFVTYAVCTSPEYRGHGLAAMLVSRAREDILGKGGVSIVCPSDPSLEAWYADLGYTPYFRAKTYTLFAAEDDDEYEDFDDYDIDIGDGEAFEAFTPAIDLKAVDRELYNRYREAFLTDRPHVGLSGAMLRMVESECEDDGGLYTVNGGDAICVITTAENGSLVMAEFMLSPVLEELSLEIDSEITAGIARQLGAYEVTYSTPGGRKCQAMAAGLDSTETEEQYHPEPYFGFPIY